MTILLQADFALTTLHYYFLFWPFLVPEYGLFLWSFLAIFEPNVIVIVTLHSH